MPTAMEFPGRGTSYRDRELIREASMSSSQEGGKGGDGIVRAAFASCLTYTFCEQHKLNQGQSMSGRYQHSMRIGDQNKRMTPERVALRFLSSFRSKTYRVVVRHKAIAAGLQTFSTSVGVRFKDWKIRKIRRVIADRGNS